MTKCLALIILTIALVDPSFGQSLKPVPPECAKKEIITSDGVHLFVQVKGSGTPCLYIHGGPGAGSYWMQKFSGDMLERKFQMIYLDQRGVGRSTSPKDGNYSMERMVKDFEEVRAALGIRQWIILGHSFGGILQMGYAQRHPQSIRGMIMLNCTLDMEDSLEKSWIPKACEILGLDTKPYLDPSVPTADRLSRLAEKLNERDLLWKMAYASQKSEKTMNASFSEISDWNQDFGSAALRIKDYSKNFRPATKDIRMPVLFFYGKQDWMIGPTHYQSVHFPNAIMWASEVGHVASLENKADLQLAISSYKNKYRL